MPVVAGRLWPTAVTAALLASALTALAGTADPAAAQAPGRPAAPVPSAVTHPDQDHLGSTVRAHLSTTGQAAAGPASADGSQPLGMDVSGYQGNVDWPTAAAHGASFVYVKATESTGYQNPFFAQQYNGSLAAGLVHGAYHFAIPNDSDGVTQATYFVTHGGGWTADGNTLPPMLDIEYNPYGAVCYGLTPGQMSSWIRAFSNTVQTLTGRYPAIYSTADWWNYCTGYDSSFASTNPLVLAAYASSPGSPPAGWQNQTIWQNSDHGVFPGDQEVLNGPLDELTEFAVAGATPYSPLQSRYAQLGGAGSGLGTPSGNQYAIPGGAAQSYTAGANLYYTPATGVRLVRGSILVRYLGFAGPVGRLGIPLTDELTTPDGIGRYNHFTNGASIYWTPATGAEAVQGAIRGLWAADGWEQGPLGYPTTNELTTPDGIGRYNHFTGPGGAGGSVYWTPRTGAHAVQGDIRGRWAAEGWEQGPLGYPTTDEMATPDGIGRYNHFAGAGGSIYWSLGTGAHSVQGLIAASWATQGWEAGQLGYPVSDEYAVPGGRRSDFQHGSITWTPATGIVVQHS